MQDDDTIDIRTDRPISRPPAAARSLADLQRELVLEILLALKLAPPGHAGEGRGTVAVDEAEKVRTLIAHYTLEIMRL